MRIVSNHNFSFTNKRQVPNIFDNKIGGAMKYSINNAVVIGSGTMGATIAALLANVGIPVTLLDIVPRDLTPKEEAKGLTLKDRAVRNRIAQEGLDRAVKSKPANFTIPDYAEMITVGNLDDDFEVIGQVDWVIEVIIENLEIKQDLMARIDEIRRPETIVSTNTSGIPVASISQGRSEGFRQHFLGTHFFNPPRYMKLLEIIPTPDTLPEVVKFITHFGEYRLGKGIVFCKDTPNFIGNRIFSITHGYALSHILENGYSVAEADAITGPLMGRPKTGTFRLMDLVGIDVGGHVSVNLAKAIPHDEIALKVLSSEKPRVLTEAMIEKGWLGLKSKQGYYKTVRKNGKKEFWTLNFETMEHDPPGEKPRFDSVGKVKDIEDLGERMKALLNEEDRAAELVRAITYFGMYYASHCVPEITELPSSIDDAARWGFAHQMGPFEIWDQLGVKSTVENMRTYDLPPAEWVDEMLETGLDTFYQYEYGSKVGAYNPVKKEYEPLRKAPGLIVLKAEKEAGKVVVKNLGATLIDIGDGVGCVEFHTKMNALDEDINKILHEALERAETEFDGLVIGNDADNFSAGANILVAVLASQNEMWEEIDNGVRTLQNLHLRMRYFPKPVVAAPAGITFGGGAEMVMHGNRVVAASELYIGLVELGVGLIPAGGGCKEMLRRMINPHMRAGDADVIPYLQPVFEQIGQGKYSTSADEASRMGFLSPQDRIVMNRDHLLAEAKREVLHMVDSGYVPQRKEKIYAAGRDALAAVRVNLYMFKEGGFISDHDTLIAGKLGYILSGGELSKPTWVDEQYILDLEREAFLSLCGEKKTQERMWHTLRTGKLLRN
jgi:3-hydroxyacyl-CoA dehydrogenase